MAGNAPVKVNPKELKNAEALWDNFIKASKWGIIITAVILLGLTAAFVPFGS